MSRFPTGVKRRDIEIFIGADNVFEFAMYGAATGTADDVTVTDENGDEVTVGPPLDLFGWSGLSQCRLATADNSLIFDFSISLSGNVVTATLPRADSSAITVTDDLLRFGGRYDIMLVTPQDHAEIYAIGMVRFIVASTVLP